MRRLSIALLTLLFVLSSLVACNGGRRLPGRGGGSNGDSGGGTGGHEPERPLLESGETDFGIYPSLNNKYYFQYSAEKLEELEITRIITTAQWSKVMPSPGEYSWKGLDAKINRFAKETGAKVFLRILAYGQNPAGDLYWYCDPKQNNHYSCVFAPEHEQDFKDFVDALTKRYAGKIDRIQFGNEWDTSWHFMGSAEDFVKYTNWFYDICKRNMPGTVVSLGGITKGALSYASRCLLKPGDKNYVEEMFTEDGTPVAKKDKSSWCDHVRSRGKFTKVKHVLENARYDIVDLHVYDDPEYWDEYVGILRSYTDKPIVMTEFGGPDPENIYIDPTDEAYQAEELKKYIKKIRELGIPEAYYFKLVQDAGTYHNDSGLVKIAQKKPEYVLEEKPTFQVFKNRYRIPLDR